MVIARMVGSSEDQLAYCKTVDRETGERTEGDGCRPLTQT